MSIVSRTMFAALFFSASVVNAAIVNVDGTWEFWRYRYTPIQFETGVYTIKPVGVADGGMFDAWNAWGFDVVSGCTNNVTCEKGFLNSYSFGYIDSIGFVQEIATIGGRVDNGTATIYPTAAAALANAETYAFTVTEPTQLYFYVRDFEAAYLDNTGGVSLRVELMTPVPEPRSWLLFAAGLVLTGFAFRETPYRTRTRPKRGKLNCSVGRRALRDHLPGCR